MEGEMKWIGRIIICLSAVALLVSCMNNWEGKGNAAYASGKRASGDKQRLQLKTAYQFYQKAIQANPERINNRLRERFVELSLLRANMVLNEGTAHSDAIPLFEKDIETYLNTDVPVDLKQQYALFLSQIADSCIANDKISEAVSQLNKALLFAINPAPINEKKTALIGRICKDNYEMADMEYTEGKKSKDAEALVKAEFHVQIALLFDSAYPGAKQLLSTLRKENKGTYSAYLKVIQDIGDSTIFKKINRFDILMAVPSVSSSSATVNLYNYSYDPLRMKSDQFFLVDVNGNKYQALPKAIDPEMLDQEHETKVILKFPTAKAAVEKIIYQNGDHYSEKIFM
jgi:tetratricopeptide (TPR) repeat protein